MEHLGKAVRMLVGGRMMSVWLSDWDSSSSSYNGFAVTVGKSLDTDQSKQAGFINGIEFRPVRGARPYPYSERPNYAFQFVEVGDDESPLLAIGQANVGTAPAPAETVEEEASPIPGEASGTQDPRTYDKRDANKDGVTTPEELAEFQKNKGERRR
jgi:hypothetical protein